MTTRRTGLEAFVVTVLLALAVESRAQDPCAPWGGGPPKLLSGNIKVSGAAGNMAPNSTAIAQGMGEWNSCQGVPNFSTASGVSPITVTFWDGRNDGTHVVSCGQECGCWKSNDRIVHVFTQNHDGSRNCMLTWGSLIAHELGHALGLSNAEPWCGDCRIMGNTACGPSVSSADCDIIDPNWFVEGEDEEECEDPPPLEGGTHNWDPCPGETCPPTCTPIFLDLAGDGFRFTGTREGVDFDMMGIDQLVRVAWSEPRNDDVLLVLDRNNSGWIEDGGELFGNFTAQPPALEPNGYRALELFDKPELFGNEDGRIDRDDRVYGALLVWRDRNQNGLSEVSELYTLEETGVDAIYLDYWESDDADKHGNELRYFGRVCLSAAPGIAADWGTTGMPPEDDPAAPIVLDPMGLRDGTVPLAALATDCAGRIVQSTDVFFVSAGEAPQK